MEDLSQNGFLKWQPQMNFHSPPNNEMKKIDKEGGSSSGSFSSKKPPLPSFRTSSLVDETHMFPINNQNKSNNAVATVMKHRFGRVSLMTDQELIEFEQKTGRTIDPATVDVKKLKRTIANRISAQKYRQKKSKRTEEMEKTVRELEGTISVTKIQIESIRKTKEMSRKLNIMMKERLEYASRKSHLIKKEIEKNRAEANWLNEYLQIVRSNAPNAEKERIESRFVDHYEHRNPAEMEGHGEISNQFSNREDIINYHQSTNPAN